jgi:hypothetical protein
MWTIKWLHAVCYLLAYAAAVTQVEGICHTNLMINAAELSEINQ